MELYEAIIIEFDQIEIEKPSTKKRVRIYAEDEALMVFYKTLDYINNKASNINNNVSINTALNYSA